MTSTTPSVKVVSDIRTWNKAIKKNTNDGNFNRALSTYVRMQIQGYFPDNFTFPLLFKAVTDPRLGSAIHAQAIKTGCLRHLYVQTSLLNMYSSFNLVDIAHQVFDEMHVKDVVAFNSMLDAYASNGLMEEANEMFESAEFKDVIAFNTMISGYAKSGRLELVMRLFDAAPERDVMSWNSMILACVRAGDMKRARGLFDRMSDKNVVTWNTMVAGFVRNEMYDEAVEVFEQMRERNDKCDHVTVSSVLAACAHLGSAESGRAVHVYALDHNLMCCEVTTSLIDMYAKCGCIDDCMHVFYKSRVKDVFSWNAVISGLAFNGHANAALKLFDVMKRGESSLRPDDITYIAVLSACAHAGLVQEGCTVFSSLKNPKKEHYGCMVDMLGKANMVREAYELVKTMPYNPGKATLGALLSACVYNEDRDVGRKVVGMMMKRAEKMSDGEYMMVSNMYATWGEWEEAAKWRQMLSDEGIVKTAGCSRIHLHSTTRSFLANQDSLPLHFVL